MIVLTKYMDVGEQLMFDDLPCNTVVIEQCVAAYFCRSTKRLCAKGSGRGAGENLMYCWTIRRRNGGSGRRVGGLMRILNIFHLLLRFCCSGEVRASVCKVRNGSVFIFAFFAGKFLTFHRIRSFRIYQLELVDVCGHPCLADDFRGH